MAVRLAGRMRTLLYSHKGEVRPTSTKSLKSHHKARRRRNFWEPIYEANFEEVLPQISWDFTRTSGPRDATLLASDLDLTNDVGQRIPLKRFTFTRCDFVGEFGPRRLSFKECNFYRCDFGSGVWRYTKFSKCVFQDCTFSQAILDHCDFQECEFVRIGISGNDMRLDGTTLTNPEKFIHAAYTNLDKLVLEKNKTNILYQKMRLESSKATVARTILSNLESAGKEEAYYEAVKVSGLQQNRSRRREVTYKLSQPASWASRIGLFGLAIVLPLEAGIMRALGLTNGWGRSIFRPIVGGVMILTIFSLIYWKLAIRCTALDALSTSFEITFLFGYTKASVVTDPSLTQTVMLVNAVIGLTWYGVAAPTLINRLSRVR